jgi:hypothetical protein
MLHGRLGHPAIAVVGVWDPFLSSHRTLLERLRDHAHGTSRSALGVLIDPAPGSQSNFRFRYGGSSWPVYDSVQARVGFLLNTGLDAVLCMHFTKRDFTLSAETFLDVVRAHTRLAELWLGALQHLGPGPQGSQAAIADYAARHGISLTILPLPPVGTYDVRSFLASGRVMRAIEVVGRPPVWTRPRSGALHLAWQPGQYHAVELAHANAIHGGAEFSVELSPRPRGVTSLSWPSRDARYLAFVSGPSDPLPAGGRATLSALQTTMGGAMD